MAMDLGWNNNHHQDCQSDIILDHHQTVLLFITVPTIDWCIIPIGIVAIIATFAAIQEGYYIGTRREII